MLKTNVFPLRGSFLKKKIGKISRLAVIVEVRRLRMIRPELVLEREDELPNPNLRDVKNGIAFVGHRGLFING